MLGVVAYEVDGAVGAVGVVRADEVQVDVLRALAHPVRWGILLRLAAEPGICACDFTEFFDVSQPTISAHLKVLREAGLVTTRRNGTTICYSIAPGPLGALSVVLAGMATTAATAAVPAVPAAEA
jgi:ArsR family transcriptional regulator